MNSTDLVSQLQEHLTNKPVFAKALSQLSPGTEIQLLIEGRELALFYQDHVAQVMERPAHKPDVAFQLSPAALAELQLHPGTDMAEFGIAVVQQIIQGQIQVRVCGSLFGIMTKGYLNIIKAAGPDFMSFMAQHGFKSLQKIISLIKALKN